MTKPTYEQLEQERNELAARALRQRTHGPAIATLAANQ